MNWASVIDLTGIVVGVVLLEVMTDGFLCSF